MGWLRHLFGARNSWPVDEDHTTVAEVVMTAAIDSQPATSRADASGVRQENERSMAAAAAISAPSVVDSYTLSGSHDEMLRADRQVGAHWQPLLQTLDSLSHEQRLERIERINMRVREIGIAHDLFADPNRNVQPWRLDLVPLVFSADEWSVLERAVIQRGRLFEALLDDIYGAQTTLRNGLVPSELVFSDPSYLRACQNIQPSAGRIQFFAVDLARDAKGTWHVADSHLETPAGIGYALANRIALTHVSGDMFAASKAIRLASYFERLQEGLAVRANRPDPTIALLTPGPRHNDFFSHAYLARYLGLLLVEGEDLRVDDGLVHLKTLDGLQPIDLLVRCIAGASADPLELDPSGFLGPVGLVQAARRTPNLVANSLGTALAENRGLGGYLPGVCRSLLGEELAIWDVKKWWLGDPTVRTEVLGNLDRYFIRSACEQTARPGRAAAARDPATLTAAERAALVDLITFEGASYVAEEKSTLGTTPSYGAKGLEPTPFAVRIFAAAGPDGFMVMPGGLAMTVNPGASTALTSPEGASRDVWVVSDAPQPPFKSLWRPSNETLHMDHAARSLPSRAADNLFWLGRYIESADWTFRLLRNCLSRIEEDSGPHQEWQVMRSTLNLQLERDGAPPVAVPAGLDDAHAVAFLARALMGSTDRAYALPQILGHVHRVASVTRDRLSLEAWRTLNAFYVRRRWQPQSLPSSIGEQLDLIDAGLGVVAAFNGLSHENMTRNFGWSFLDMGRRLKRAENLAELLLAAFGKRTPGEEDSGRYLFVLELSDSFITYRSRYRLKPLLAPLLELLVLDETNPRSIGFQVAALVSHLDQIPQSGTGHDRTDVQRIALSMLSDIRLAEAARLAEADDNGRRLFLQNLLSTEIARVPELTDALTRRYFSVVENKPRWMRAQTRQES